MKVNSSIGSILKATSDNVQSTTYQNKEKWVRPLTVDINIGSPLGTNLSIDTIFKVGSP